MVVGQWSTTTFGKALDLQAGPLDHWTTTPGVAETEAEAAGAGPF